MSLDVLDERLANDRRDLVLSDAVMRGFDPANEINFSQALLFVFKMMDKIEEDITYHTENRHANAKSRSTSWRAKYSNVDISSLEFCFAELEKLAEHDSFIV